MFYEGTEKRLSIATKSVNLFDLAPHFWQQLVAQSGAEILSSIHTASVQAYLLSESSLFVWQDKILLITCGNTQLVKAALFIQQQFSKQQINTLIFQRHQALQPLLQDSSFEQDTLLLSAQFQGQQQHWDEDYKGDLFVFGEISPDTFKTRNIYMFHGLRGDFAERLQKQGLDKQAILSELKLTYFFANLSVDHHSFEPTGYSLNAICDADYLTIHLTPEQQSTYLSIETSFNDSRCAVFIEYLMHLFSPLKAKKMHFKPQQQQLNITIS
jgi:S-adenosylmethionine decarboxylase